MQGPEINPAAEARASARSRGRLHVKKPAWAHFPVGLFYSPCITCFAAAPARQQRQDPASAESCLWFRYGRYPSGLQQNAKQASSERSILFSAEYSDCHAAAPPPAGPLHNMFFDSPDSVLLQFSARYRKVTACALVQLSSGLNAVSAVPEVMPFATAQSTAPA